MLDKYIPKLDLHGENSEYAKILIADFINDNYLLGNKKIEIIHGKGKGILKKTVLNELKNNKLVKEYRINYFNDGCTIISLK